MFFRKKKSVSEHSDAELISLYRQSDDKEYATELFLRYTHLLVGVCMKYLKDEENSKDASMQIYEKLLTDLKKHEIGNFKAWLHTVARNHCLMELRKKRPSEEISESGVELSFQLHPLEKEEDELKLETLSNGLEKLNEEQRVCIRLFYLEEKSYKDIVTLTGYSMNDVKSYIQNGKRNLKNFMTKNYEQS